MCMPFFVIVAVNALRLKYSTSYYTRFEFNRIASAIEGVLPDILYAYTIGWLKTWISATIKNKEKESQVIKKDKGSDDEP